MRFLQAQKNKFNAVIYVGSNAIFRRQALQSVGGFVTDVITEDMATGLLVQNEGWKSEFVNKVLATGLSPETFPELIKQRVRWAKGNVQVFKKYGPKTLKNLSRTQKLLYVDGVHYWFFGVYHFLYLLFPLLTILLGIQVVNAPGIYFIPVWFVSYMLSNMVFSSVAGKEFRPMWASVGELAIFPYITWGVLKETFFDDSSSFQVTTKGQIVDKTTYNWGMMKTQIIFLILSLISLAIIFGKLIVNPVQTLTYWSLPLFWLLYNIVSLVGALHISIDRPRYLNQLIPLKEVGTLLKDNKTYPVNVVRIHSGKAVIETESNGADNLKEGDDFQLCLTDKVLLPVSISQIENIGDKFVVSLIFDNLDNETYIALHSFLDNLNTQVFKKRSTNYRHPGYHLTIGYYSKRKEAKNLIQY